jgi:hypothetical protein
MASTINTSLSERLFQPRRCKISDILTVDDNTLTVSGGTLMSDDQHQLSGAIASVTR